MDYTIATSTIKELINEEVSHVADAAYADDGTSLYDSIVLTSKDDNLVGRFIDDGVRQLARATYDICKYGSGKLTFNVPDFDATTQATYVTAAIDRYLAMYATAAILQQRRAGLVPEYTNRVQDAMNGAITLLRKREAPSRS